MRTDDCFSLVRALSLPQWTISMCSVLTLLSCCRDPPWLLLEFISLRVPSRLFLVAGWFGSSGRLPSPESVEGDCFRLPIVVDWDFVFHLPLRSPAVCFLSLEYEFPIDGANVKVGFLNDCPKDFEWGTEPQ
ncbi:hypothetical protein PIB30_072930 [Stylosanthes scabra]|uniref:Uncharacterized protein n=1 Tax=Stylosanthes scabra TaxID=79078 RepID=A0ABU6WQ88_9FABA|nr:hypothetical protein [Stylosanthes scabra]